MSGVPGSILSAGQAVWGTRVTANGQYDLDILRLALLDVGSRLIIVMPSNVERSWSVATKACKHSTLSSPR